MLQEKNGRESGWVDKTHAWLYMTSCSISAEHERHTLVDHRTERFSHFSLRWYLIPSYLSLQVLTKIQQIAIKTFYV